MLFGFVIIDFIFDLQLRRQAFLMQTNQLCQCYFWSIPLCNILRYITQSYTYRQRQTKTQKQTYLMITLKIWEVIKKRQNDWNSTLICFLFSWIVEKAEANLTDGKVVTSDKDSAVLLGLRTRQYQFQVTSRLLVFLKGFLSTVKMQSLLSIGSIVSKHCPLCLSKA